MRQLLHSPLHELKNQNWFKRFSLTLLAASVFAIAAFSQTNGDFRSVMSGNWSSTATWEVFTGSWVPATTYPGQTATSAKVTINTGHFIIADVDLITFAIQELHIEGSGRLDINFNGTRQLHIEQLYIDPVVNVNYAGPNITFGGPASALRLPTNAFIAYAANYKALPESNKAPNGSCNNNNALYIGGGSLGGTQFKYSACAGGGNVCVTFKELNVAGGTIRVIPEFDVTSALGFGNISCNNNFLAKVRILGILTGSTVDLDLGPNLNVVFNPATFTNLVDGGSSDADGLVNGSIEVPVNVETPSLVGTANPVTYSATASALLDFQVAQNDPCFGFEARNSVTRQFVVRPPANMLVGMVPQTVCVSDEVSFALENKTSLQTTLFFRVNNVPASITLAGNATGSIPVATGSPVMFTFNFDSLKFTDGMPGCKVVLGSTATINVTAAGGLAIDGDVKNDHNLGASSLVTSATGCRAIAGLQGTTVTRVNGKAWVNGGGMPVYYQGLPYVGRRIMLEPTIPQNTPTNVANVTLFFTQQEFTEFNNSPNNYWELPSDPMDLVELQNLRVYKFENGSFDPMTGLPTVASLGTAIANGDVTVIDPNDMNIVWQGSIFGGVWAVTFTVTDFSLFMVSNDQPFVLPLNLLTFDAKLNGKRNADLIWKTTEERDVQGFEVQVSRDGSQFSSVGMVNARNTLAGGDYEFTTAMPGKLAYFRLKMIDKNGSFTFSPVKTLRTDDLIINSYPNPVQDQLIVDLTGYPAGTMRIMDMSGRTMVNGRTVEGINRLNTSALTNGIYILEVNVGLESEKIKISKFNR